MTTQMEATTPTMTGTASGRPVTAQEGLAAIRRLLGPIAERAAEIEAARRVPMDLLDDLIAAGCFRMLLPASHGGLDARLDEALIGLEELAAADASVGWVVMIGSGSWIDLAGLPQETFDELFPAGRDVIVAGAFNPSGSIVPADGGYRVRGRWAFASGCEHADWIFGNCLEGIVGGHPQLRIAVFRPDQVVIEDTWRVAGMCGTGSHHFHVDDVNVPASRTFVPFVGPHAIDSPYVRVPPPPLYALAVSAVAIGIARGALSDIEALSSEKVPIFSGGPLATNPLFQYDLADAETTWRAARALVHSSADELWAMAHSGDEMSDHDRARMRAAAVWATDRAVAVTRAAYRAGGSTSLYLDCPLQRRLRDIDALTQHFLVRRDTMRTAGGVYAGQPIDVPVF